MTEGTVKVIAEALIAEHLSGWKFSFNGVHGFLGQCKHSEKTIVMSTNWIKLCTDLNIVDTLLHEIAHAQVGPGHGHDGVWRAAAKKLGATLASCSKEAMPTDMESYRQIGAKYLLVDETGKVWRHWVRKPAKNTFDTIGERFVTGHKAETLGKLKIIPVPEA